MEKSLLVVVFIVGVVAVIGGFILASPTGQQVYFPESQPRQNIIPAYDPYVTMPTPPAEWVQECTRECYKTAEAEKEQCRETFQICMAQCNIIIFPEEQMVCQAGCNSQAVACQLSVELKREKCLEDCKTILD